MNRKSSSKKVSTPTPNPRLGGKPLVQQVSTARGGRVVKAPTKFTSANEQKNIKPGTSKFSAPVKKIPNVHSVTDLPSGAGADPQVVWRQLGQERQRNKILQLEIERLRKSLDICKRTVKEKCSEVEAKNKLINKLIEDKTKIESINDGLEDNIDIDNLLHANLGEVDLSDILNLTGSAFPDDLDSLDVSNFMSNQAKLSLSPTSLAMATNTSYVIEQEVQNQFPNREGSTEVQEDTVKVKGVVGRMVDQKKSYLSSQEYISEAKDVPKVSPIKIKIMKGDHPCPYQLASRNKQQVTVPLTSDTSTPCKKLKLSSMSAKDASPVPHCLSCPHCGKQFPLGGQWKLTRHLSSAHSNTMVYSCQDCDKQFPCQSILTAHTKWHKLTNPWQCGDCGYRLGNLSQFIKHAKSAHKVSSLPTIRKLLIPAME